MSMILRDGRAAEVSSDRPADDAVIDRARRLGAKNLRDRGYTVRQIARHYGVTRQTIYNWLATIPADAAGLAVL